jgi:hypothetical protein
VINTSPGTVSKIETRVYKDPAATQDTYILCIATLTTTGTTYLERRRFRVGWTGIEGPESIATSQFPTDEVYNDIDIIDAKEACIFIGLAGAVCTSKICDQRLKIDLLINGTFFFKTIANL